MGSGGGTVRLLLLQPQWQGWLKTSAHGAALINCSMTCIYASTYDMTIFIDSHILTYIHTCRGLWVQDLQVSRASNWGVVDLKQIPFRRETLHNT